MATAEVITIPPKECLPSYPENDNDETELQAFWPSTTQSRPTLYIDATHIVSSPYQNFTNQLHLESLEKPVRLFALALMILRPIRLDFRTGPYMSVFNWSDVFTLLRNLCLQTGAKWPKQEFYVVIFRSKLRNGIDRERLGELDQRSHEEACASGGLLKYWFGTSNGENRNLATCIWRNREDARAGGSGPWHKLARGAARDMYETISFHTHRLVVEADVASWRLEEYEA